MSNAALKVVAITGASGGIGSAVARAFADTNTALSLSDLSRASLDALSHELAKTCRIASAVVDISCQQEVANWIRETMDRFGQIDVLVNVAGVRANGPAATLTETEWDRVIDINLKGTFLCCQAVIPIMKAQKSGRIINLGSVLGKNGGNARPWIDESEQQSASNVAYGVSKAGVHAMTSYLAKELASYGVTVNAVAPGPVTSPMTANSPASRRALIPLHRYASAEEVAHAVLFLASEKSRYITGEVLDVNGGLWCD